MHWIHGGGPIAFAGFGASENKGIVFAAFSLQYSHALVLDGVGIASGGRGPIAFELFGMIPISYGIPSLRP